MNLKRIDLWVDVSEGFPIRVSSSIHRQVRRETRYKVENQLWPVEQLIEDQVEEMTDDLH